MEIENIPAWVPEAVRRFNAAVPTNNEYYLRFLTNPRMENVWGSLGEKAIVPGIIKTVDPHGVLSAINMDMYWHPKDEDYALAAFNWIVIQTTYDVYEGKPIARIKSQLEKAAKPYDDLIAGCIGLKRNEAFWCIPIDRDVALAADKIIDYAQKMSDLIKQEDKPYLLKRSSKDRGEDDAVRAWTLRIAHGMKEIWGQCSYSTLATIAEALFDLQPDHQRKDTVKKWCQEMSGK